MAAAGSAFGVGEATMQTLRACLARSARQISVSRCVGPARLENADRVALVEGPRALARKVGGTPATTTTTATIAMTTGGRFRAVRWPFGVGAGARGLCTASASAAAELKEGTLGKQQLNPSQGGEGGGVGTASKNRRVFVTNLSYRATEDDLRGFLEREGELESVRIKYTLVDGARQSRGFATAVFNRAEDAWSAIANLDDTTFQGRRIKVREDNFSKLDRKSVAHKNVEKKVFVDFLDPSLLWQDVKDHFQQTGSVYFVHLLWDQTRMHRQAVVELGSAEEAQDAIRELNDSVLRDAAMRVRAYTPQDMQEKEPMSPTVFVNYIHPEVELEDLNNHFLRVVPNIEFSKIFFHKTDDYQQAKVTLSSTAVAKMAIERVDRSLLNGKVIRCRAFLDNNNNSSRYLQGVWRERRVSRGPQAPRCQIENLNPRVGWQEVKDHLREAGSVVHVNVSWAEDGNSKQAIAEVSSERDLEEIVLKLDQSLLLGEKMTIRRL